jgi:hypothetical protein
LKACGIIIVRGGQMFVDFVGHPYTQIYVDPLEHVFICFYLDKCYPNCIVYELPTKLHPNQPVKIWVPTNFGPLRIKMIPQYMVNQK